MITVKPRKAQYSETEAAEALGVSINELRRLIRHHIVGGEEDLAPLSQASFQPSDLLLLRILAGQCPQPAASC
jgi:hypothetical protein